MSGAVALGGWTMAILAAVAAWVVWRALGGRMEAVARACHELRGPITAARLGLQLGARAGELSAARLRAVELELVRASAALDDLAHAREGRRCQRALEDVDVAELLADSVEAWRAFAVARGVDLRLDWSGAAASVLGDRVRLAQAVGNLIANAIEHGAGPVEVQGATHTATVWVQVSDHGQGLPAPLAALTRRAQSGRGDRGRGLAIVAEIAADHGGQLIAAPRDHGARLVLELPAAAALSMPKLPDRTSSAP